MYLTRPNLPRDCGTTAALAFIAVTFVTSSACDTADRIMTEALSKCHRIYGSPASTGQSIQFGDPASYLNAEIAEVRTACLQVDNSASSQSTPAGRHVNYDVAVTAVVHYRIADDARFSQLVNNRPFMVTIIFEALDSNAVVLGASEAQVAIVRHQTTGTASTRITGFGPNEIPHVALIQARWRYGLLP